MFDHIQAYYQPQTVKEALRLMHGNTGKGCVIAGGTDLALKAGRSVTYLVDISKIGLDYIKREGKGLRIGATTTMSALETSGPVRHLADGILANAAATCGSVQTRNMATIGGNLANASPAADLATPLLVLDAEVVLAGTKSSRTVPLMRFFAGPHETTMNGSLMTEIVIPAPKAHTAFAFHKFGRTEVDISLVNVAAGVRVDSHGRCNWVRLALGAVAPRPMRAVEAEGLMLGEELNQSTIERAATLAAGEIDPISDVRASAEYRREITEVLVRRALRECAQRLECAL